MYLRRVYSGLAILCVFCACMTSGPSTEEGNPQIVAVVVDPDKRPVGGVSVTAYLVAAQTDAALPPSSALTAAATQTDATGSCSFDRLPPGTYSLVANDSVGKRSALRSNIVIAAMRANNRAFFDTLILAPTGAIRGTVTRNGVLGTYANQNLGDAFIQVKIAEIDRSTVTGPDGGYVFSDVPAGSYTLYFYAADGFYSVRKESITVTPGGGVTVEKVVLVPVPRLVPPSRLRAVYDTAAATVTISWERVLFDSLRWYELERIDLTGPRDTVIICTDIQYTDTLYGIARGSVLDYVVRSVDKAFNRSANAGPVEIVVAQ